jgi:phage shock protein C
MENHDPHNENIPSEPEDIEEPVITPERRLVRSISDRIFLGLCGGISHYLDVDPILMRLVFVFSILIGGWGAVIYAVAAMLIPAEIIVDNLSSEETAGLKRSNMKTLAGTSFILIGFFFIFKSWGIIGYFGALGIPLEIFWPVTFIVIGLYSLMKQQDSAGPAYSQKKFYRIRSFSRFKGVCSGLAMYLNTDSNLIRMAWIVFTFISLGLGIVIYFIIALMVPYYNES